jgi:hypothetical protein
MGQQLQAAAPADFLSLLAIGRDEEVEEHEHDE